MATGRQAFAGGTGGVIIEAVLTRTPAAVSSINPNIPPGLEEIISKALHKDRDKRYPDSASLLADIQRLTRDSETVSVATTSQLRAIGHRGGARARNAAPVKTAVPKRSLIRLRCYLSKMPAAIRNMNT